MYKLYKQPNGQIKQVPINEPQEDLEFPNPLEAKGQEQTVAPFVLQEQKQFDIIKENETQQARFQTKAINQNSLQVFNFNVSTIATGSDATIFREYNTTVEQGNVTDCIMFGVDSLNDKALYYNIKDIKCNLNIGNANSELDPDSYVQFYLLQNTTGTSSLGQKIPRQDKLNGTSSGTVTFTTTGAKQGFQYVQTDIVSDSVNVASGTQGLRASGLALKTILINFGASETLDNVNIDFQVYVDINSASAQY